MSDPIATAAEDAAARTDDQASPHAALADALGAVGDRWTLLVVAALLDGPRRFGELQRELPGIAANVLTQRLRQLERDGLVRRTYYPEIPPRVEYEISDLGRSLAPLFATLAQWSDAQLATVEDARLAYDAGDRPR